MLSPGSGTALTKRCPQCGRTYHYSERHSCGAGPLSDPLVPSSGERSPSNPEVSAEDDPILGAILGDRYLMLNRLSRGGMGVVYKARHVLLDTAVAVKILLEQQDQVAQLRFLQEAKLASQIRHPHTVYISDFGVLDDGRSYLVMELLRGPTLGRVLRDGPVAPMRACKIAAQIATGLQAVHDRGIVHRGCCRPREAPRRLPWRRGGAENRHPRRPAARAAVCPPVARPLCRPAVAGVGDPGGAGRSRRGD